MTHKSECDTEEAVEEKLSKWQKVCKTLRRYKKRWRKHLKYTDNSTYLLIVLTIVCVYLACRKYSLKGHDNVGVKTECMFK